MKCVNRVTLLGNLGHTPEIKYTANDLAIVNTTMATTYKKGDQEEVTWHKLVFFGKTAEIVEKYAAKGDTIYVEGRISNSTYEGRDGTKKNKSEVIVFDVTLLGKRQRSSEAPERPLQSDQARQASKELADSLRSGGVSAEPEPEFEDDIPFSFAIMVPVLSAIAGAIYGVQGMLQV